MMLWKNLKTYQGENGSYVLVSIESAEVNGYTAPEVTENTELGNYG